MKRMGTCIRLRPEALAQYKAVHGAVWPEILAVIKRANIQNYSIFLKEPELLMFAYWVDSTVRYLGVDLEDERHWFERTRHG